MIGVCLALCLMPTLCLASCCLPAGPPEFSLRAPPKPPGVNYDLSCPALGKHWTGYDEDDEFIHGKQKDIKHGSNADIYNHTGIEPVPFPPGEHVPSTSANPSISGNKKPVSVGMVLGIVLGLLVLLLLVVLTWMCTRNKATKYKADKRTEEDTNISFLHKCRIDSLHWKRPAMSSKMLRHLFKNPEKCEGLDSAASSESGYCEDITDNQESISPKTQVTMRNRQPKVSNSQMISVTDTTPDIIASAQIVGLDDAPKRWSMFGLLPSLKPILLNPLSQSEMPDSDKVNDWDNALLRSNSHSERSNRKARKGTDDIVMRPLETRGQHVDRKATPPAKQRRIDSGTNMPSSKSVPLKRSRVRIKNDSKQPEIEV